MRWAKAHGEAFGPVQAKYIEHVQQGLPGWGSGPYKGGNEGTPWPAVPAVSPLAARFGRGSVGRFGFALQPFLCAEPGGQGPHGNCRKLAKSMQDSFGLTTGAADDPVVDIRSPDVLGLGLPVLFEQPKRGQCVQVVVGIFSVLDSPGETTRRAQWTELLQREGHHMLSGHRLDGYIKRAQPQAATNVVQCGLNFAFVVGAVEGKDTARTPLTNTVVLPCPENMNEGKSLEWQRSASKLFPNVDYIAKMDSDTHICPSRLMYHLRMASRFRALLVGFPSSCGPHEHCRLPFRYVTNTLRIIPRNSL